MKKERKETLPKTNVFFSQVGGVDKTFRTVYYICRMLAYWMSKPRNGEVLLASLKDRTIIHRHDVADKIRKLASQFSNARYMLRFFGLFSTWESLQLASRTKDIRSRFLSQAQ